MKAPRGPGGMPWWVRLSEGLGSTVFETDQNALRYLAWRDNTVDLATVATETRSDTAMLLWLAPVASCLAFANLRDGLILVFGIGSHAVRLSEEVHTLKFMPLSRGIRSACAWALAGREALDELCSVEGKLRSPAWLFGSRRQALTLVEHCTARPV